MYPVEPIGGGTAPSQIYGASSRQRCGNDGQRKRVAHMPTATTTKEDSRSKLVQNRPHDFTKKQNSFPISASDTCTASGFSMAAASMKGEQIGGNMGTF